jgi:hypothetical protein
MPLDLARICDQARRARIVPNRFLAGAEIEREGGPPLAKMRPWHAMGLPESMEPRTKIRHLLAVLRSGLAHTSKLLVA